MKGKNIILVGVGTSVGFVAGNIFLAIKIIESNEMRKALSNIIADKIEKLLYEEPVPKKRSSSRVSYRSYYNTRNHRTQSRYETEGIVLASRFDAEEVIAQMGDIIETYGCVTVQDYYDLCGYENQEYVNGKYGWSKLDDAKIIRTGNGYVIRLPKALPVS